MRTGIYWQNRAYPGKGMDFVLDPSLALYLPLHRLDEASFMSKDAYGHLCTVTGALWRPNGRVFDGDDYIDCGDDVSLDTVDAITLEVWVKITTACRDQEILSRDDGTNRNYEFRFTSADAGSFFFWTSNVAKSVVAFTTFVVDTWYHIVATYNKQFINIYVDGAVDATPVAETGAIDNDDVSLTIGAREDGLDRFLIGTIGEVRIYRRALTPLEIQRNYLATKWRYQ